MKCSNCGSNIPASAKFCGVCGTPTAAAEPAETVALDTSANPEIQAAAAALEQADPMATQAAASALETSAEAAVEAAAQTASEPVQAAEKEDVPTASSTVESESVEIGSSQSAAKPAVAQKSESTPAGESAGKKGKFRETIWFMQADDPEMMSAIENEELQDREATYQDPGGRLDERSREKFSLNISESTMMKAMERETQETPGAPESSKSWFYASIAIGTLILTAGVYFIFFAKSGA